MKFTKLSQIRANPDNPRRITKVDIEKAAKSITEFPKMMKLRPVVVDETGMALGGNVRYHAMVSLGMEEIPEGWVVCADELSAEQKSEFIVKDNSNFGAWDFDELANKWSELPLVDWGIDITELVGSSEEKLKQEEKELQPYKKVHILISFDIDTVDNDLLDILEKLRKINGVEIEQSAN